jgi:aspartate-semialdehyde dehydrogenase
MDKLKVGVLGATGAAGLEFVRALCGHPWFELRELYASGRSAGKPFRDACTLDLSGIPEDVREMRVRGIEEVNRGLDLICSALPSEVAREVEGECARHTPVISTASAFRYEDDVPILITEVNADHHRLLGLQRRRGWEGWIAPGPNCTTVGLAISLCPIYRELGVRRVIMSSYQSVSGGGYALIQKWRAQRRAELPEPLEGLKEPIRNPEVVLEGNVIGYIEKEEEKVKRETLKILGDYADGGIRPARFRIDCSCVRVPTLRGHFETVFVETERACSTEDVKAIYEEFNERCKREFGDLPSSPDRTIVVLDRSPQPIFDVCLGGGMSTVVGRIEGIEAYDSGIKYQVLSDNTQRGAAKGMVQVAEYLHKVGYL